MRGLLSWLHRLLGGGRRSRPAPRPSTPAFGALSTWEVRDPADRTVEITYAPRRDGIPDAGEVVWAWVPYQEDPAQGKDRPLLVIARHDAQRVYAVRLTSQAPKSRHEHIGIGTGPWDRQGRESFADLERLYSVHHRGIRREAAALDRRAFARVAEMLAARHGWRFDG